MNAATTTPSDMTIMETEEEITAADNPPERKLKRINSRQLKKQPKIGRNDLCPCGSGSKYKKCCLIKQQEYFNKQVEMQKQVEELIEKTSQTDIKKQVEAIVEKSDKK